MTAELLVQPFAEASAFEGMAATRNVAEKSLSLDARITLRGSEITHDTAVEGAPSAAYSAVGLSPAERSAEPVGPLTRGGQTMTTSGENEPKAMVRDGLEAWRETVAAARQARRQRGERYVGRHRRVSVEGKDDHQDVDERSA